MDRFKIIRHTQASQLFVYEAVDLPLLPVITEMQVQGTLIDVGVLERVGAKIDERQVELLEQLQTLATAYGSTSKVNFNSPQQVSQLLFKVMNLPADPEDEGSVAIDVLEKYSDEILINYLIEYRKLAKLNSTYVKSLLTKRDSSNIVRARFNNCSTDTGRLSSSHPNLQNIPVRVLPSTPPFVTECVKEIRKAFIPPPGWVWVRFDQSQVEFRIASIFGQDENTIADIKAGIDVHLMSALSWNPHWGDYENAARLKAAGDKEVKVRRDFTKNIVYGVVYGQTEIGVVEYAAANGIRLSNEQARKIVAAVLGTRPGLLRYVEAAKDEALRTGIGTTYFGRQAKYQTLGGLGKWDRLNGRQAHELRAAVNMPVQGTSADIMKLAMAGIFREKSKRGMQARTVMMVHDEGDFVAPEGEVGVLEGLIQEMATTVVDWEIPLEIEISHGENWGVCK